jgi:hypothetical protein
MQSRNDGPAKAGHYRNDAITATTVRLKPDTTGTTPATTVRLKPG